jgi:hypothetical protein
MKLPQIPDDDADFTPDLARKIIAQYQELLMGSGSSDLEAAFTEACDEAGCEYDNEALLRAIAKLKQENSLLNSQFRNCHIEIGKLRDALLMAGVHRS